MKPITKKDLTDALEEFHKKTIEPGFNRIESYIFNRIEPRFDNIEKKLEEHDKKFADLLNHFDQIYHRLDRLETEYHTITFSIQRIEGQLDGVLKRLDHVEVRLDGIDKRLDRIEGKLDKEIDLKERLEKEVADLKQRSILLQNRIEELENHLKIIS